MTKSNALSAVEDACYLDYDDMESAIYTALKIGVTPWNIKKTLRENFIPWDSLGPSLQDALS